MTIFTSVDLPAPLSPSRPTISPRLTAKLTPDSDRTSPNVFETLRSSMTGGSAAPADCVTGGPFLERSAEARRVTRLGLRFNQRISLAASGATASTLEESTNAPAVFTSRPEKPNFLVRQMLRIGR